MARGQGKYRLQEGVTRNLTPHELRRGYIYISQDKAIKEILDVGRFTVEVIGKLFPNKRLDVSGRIHIPKTELSLLAHGEMTIRVISRTLLVVTNATQKADG